MGDKILLLFHNPHNKKHRASDYQPFSIEGVKCGSKYNI